MIVVAPLVVALATAVLTLLVRRSGPAQRAVSMLGGLGYLVAVTVLFARVRTDGTHVYQVSDWAAPFGITLVADALAVFMLALAAVVSVGALAFSVRYVDAVGQRLVYHPLYHFMMVGVTGSFLTGDLFNLFVWFEVMLMSSYVLVVFYGGPEHTRAALQYVVLNLLGSALMLLAIGGLYATTGTLNMADMARRLASPAEFGIDPTPVLGLSALLFAVFALKAGMVPFQFWVPAAYRAAPAPVSAMLAGVVKKVGVYAIVRLYFTVFAAATFPAGLAFEGPTVGGLHLGLAGDSVLSFYGPVLFLMAAASIVFGGLAAVDRDDVDDVLSYSSIGQVGFIVLPLAVGATAGGAVGDHSLRAFAVAAALIYALNHALAKAALFMASGAIYSATGTIDLGELGGLTEREPLLSGAFFVGAIALIGIPPLSGFFGKLLVFQTALRGSAGGGLGAALAVGVALAGAVLTIAYVTRAWNRGFWGDPTERVAAGRAPPAQVAVVAGLTLLVVAVGIGFEPVVDAAIEAGRAATDTAGYQEAVAPEVFE